VDPRREAERAQISSAEGGDELWSGEYGKGWNRLSITRKSGAPPLKPDDLMLPSGLGNLRMLLSCAGMSLISTVLYVWVPAMLVNFFVPINGPVMAGILVGAFLTFTVSLYLWGSIETQRDRELGLRL
jgi:hypothetical protein